MGMSTHVVGFRPEDDEWKKMKKVWESCDAAGIRPPDEVMAFFEYEEPGDKPGQEVQLGNAAKEFADEYSTGFEIDLEQLPPGIRYLRFYNSW